MRWRHRAFEELLIDIFVKSYDTFPTNLVGNLNVAHAPPPLIWFDIEI